MDSAPEAPGFYVSAAYPDATATTWTVRLGNINAAGTGAPSGGPTLTAYALCLPTT